MSVEACHTWSAEVTSAGTNSAPIAFTAATAASEGRSATTTLESNTIFNLDQFGSLWHPSHVAWFFCKHRLRLIAFICIENIKHFLWSYLGSISNQSSSNCMSETWSPTRHQCAYCGLHSKPNKTNQNQSPKPIIEQTPGYITHSHVQCLHVRIFK